MTHEEAVEYRQKIRELVKVHGVTKTAKIEGRTKSGISQIARGLRLRKRVNVECLHLEQGTGKMCRKCGNEAVLVAGETRLCVVCELTRLAQLGIVYIAPSNGTPPDMPEGVP